MSPRRLSVQTSLAVDTGLRRLWSSLGARIREARHERRWSVVQLARRAGISAGMVYRVEAGLPASTEAAVRLCTALGLRLEFTTVDGRRRQPRPEGQLADVVHSAMGEFEARRLRAHGMAVGIDEPYQHYQFAGRADLIAWDVDRRALLHIENRTRFPDLQETAGSYNAKRAYLAEALGERLGVRRWASQTHVMAGLWSSEVLHVVRLRTETFRALCPDPTTAFDSWWAGTPPTVGAASVLVILDPFARQRQRAYIGLDQAAAVRPRISGYAEGARRLAQAG